MVYGFGLSVLLDGQVLNVPFSVERSGYGPVVRNVYLLPILPVARELPLVEISFLPDLRLRNRCEGKKS